MHAVHLSNAAGRRVKYFQVVSHACLKIVKIEPFLAKLAKFPNDG
jgi:hypothetical protein